MPAPAIDDATRTELEAAAFRRLVEHLRNVEGLSTVSVHALTEVPLSFRAYYRVEVPTDAVPAQPLGEPVPEPEPVAVAPEPEATVEPAA